MTCDSNGNYERAAHWLIYDLMKELARTALSYRMSATKINTIHLIGTLTIDYLAVTYLLETYSTDNVIAESKADFMNYKQLENTSFAGCLEILRKKG